MMKVTILFLLVILSACEDREMDTIEDTSENWEIIYSETSNEDGVLESVFNFTFIGEGSPPKSISYKLSQGSSFMNRYDFPLNDDSFSINGSLCSSCRIENDKIDITLVDSEGNEEELTIEK